MNQPTPEQKAEQEAQREEMRQRMLDNLMTPEARERLGRIKLVKPEKARQLEDVVIAMAQQGQTNGIIDDASLVEILNRASASRETTVKIEHKRRKRDDEWDDDEDGW